MVSGFECERDRKGEAAMTRTIQREASRAKERAESFFLSYLKPHQNSMDFKPFSSAHYMLIRFQFEDFSSNLNTNWDRTRRRALEIEPFFSFFLYQSELSCKNLPANPKMRLSFRTQSKNISVTNKNSFFSHSKRIMTLMTTVGSFRPRTMTTMTSTIRKKRKRKKTKEKKNREKKTFN